MSEQRRRVLHQSHCGSWDKKILASPIVTVRSGTIFMWDLRRKKILGGLK